MRKQTNYITKEYFDKTLDEKIGPINKKLDWIMEKIDWLMGKYQAHDQEHILLTDKVSEHNDRLEVIENKIGIQTA